PVMLAHPGGSIVNVASLAGRRGMTPLGGYCATKFALIGLSEALRTEVDSDVLHVGLVLPGVVETPMVSGIDQVEGMPNWPAQLNMPPEWVSTAIALAGRFRLREIGVPPGAALLEELGALMPGVTDAIIGWMRDAGQLLARGGRSPSLEPPVRILYLTHAVPDYLSDDLLYGLRALLGSDLVDYPRKDVLYRTSPLRPMAHTLYGGGFHCFGLDDAAVDRSDLAAKVAGG